MLVCRHCGTALASAGPACPSCGRHGAIDARFYKGKVKGAERLAERPGDGTLLSHERAWTPWLAGLFAVLCGPPAGALMAATNLRRLDRLAVPISVPAALAIVGQVAIWSAAGLVGRHNGMPGLLFATAANLAVASGIVAWQWSPVRAWREEHPGRHTPGEDAVAAGVAAVVLSMASGLGAVLLGDLLSGRHLLTALR
jgi:hypothetical protein